MFTPAFIQHKKIRLDQTHFPDILFFYNELITAEHCK